MMGGQQQPGMAMGGQREPGMAIGDQQGPCLPRQQQQQQQIPMMGGQQQQPGMMAGQQGMQQQQPGMTTGPQGMQQQGAFGQGAGAATGDEALQRRDTMRAQQQDQSSAAAQQYRQPQAGEQLPVIQVDTTRRAGRRRRMPAVQMTTTAQPSPYQQEFYARRSFGMGGVAYGLGPEASHYYPGWTPREAFMNKQIRPYPSRAFVQQGGALGMLMGW